MHLPSLRTLGWASYEISFRAEALLFSMTFPRYSSDMTAVGRDMDDYKVKLDAYSGPLDLLLFLIRREEIDVYDIPIAEVTRQYMEYVRILEQIDPEAVGEFLVLAATLMEIKSRTLLPRPPAEEFDGPLEDPRQELVRQLLEYKTFKETARRLEFAAETQSLKHPRVPVLPEEPKDEVDLEGVDVWDLFRAFQRLLEQVGKLGPVHRVQIDDTPIALHADDILDALQRAEGVRRFEDVFAGRSRAEMIGLFLALLELIRQKRIRVSQDRPFGEILIHLLDATPLSAVTEEAEAETELTQGQDAAVLSEADAEITDEDSEDLGVFEADEDLSIPASSGQPINKPAAEVLAAWDDSNPEPTVATPKADVDAAATEVVRETQ